jgi:hypothetical protein
VTDTAQVPVTDTAQVPVTDTARVPVTDTAQVPVTDTAQVPVTDTAQAPVTDTHTQKSHKKQQFSDHDLVRQRAQCKSRVHTALPTSARPEVHVTFNLGT